MKYRIKISEILPPKDGEKYDQESEIYDQVVSYLDVPGLVMFINSQWNPKKEFGIPIRGVAGSVVPIAKEKEMPPLPPRYE